MKGYKTSRAYKKLWKIIHLNYRVLGWARNNRLEMWDCVEIKWLKRWNKYMIGSRGVGYDGTEQTEKDFCRICKAFNIKYIAPTDIKVK